MSGLLKMLVDVFDDQSEDRMFRCTWVGATLKDALEHCDDDHLAQVLQDFAQYDSSTIGGGASPTILFRLHRQEQKLGELPAL